MELLLIQLGLILLILATSALWLTEPRSKFFPIDLPVKEFNNPKSVKPQNLQSFSKERLIFHDQQATELYQLWTKHSYLLSDHRTDKHQRFEILTPPYDTEKGKAINIIFEEEKILSFRPKIWQLILSDVGVIPDLEGLWSTRYSIYRN